MAASLWEFFKSNAVLIFTLIAVTLTCNYYFSSAPLWLSTLWNTLLPSALIAWIAHRAANRAELEHTLVLETISERLSKGYLTEAERKLGLRLYDRLRDKLHDAVVRGNSFHAGESLQIMLMKALRGDPEEIQRILSKLPTAPSNVLPLTSEEEKFLARLGADNTQCAKVVVQWLLNSGGQPAIERLFEEQAFEVDETTICGYILDLIQTLPHTSKQYSWAVDYLSQREDQLKGRTAFLSGLQSKLLDCEDYLTFRGTVDVIRGINSDAGLKTLNTCYRHRPMKRERKVYLAQAINKLKDALPA
ncbi:MAG: hypothetical protein ACK5AZ_18115 [Bryobacteraceae bacterium]